MLQRHAFLLATVARAQRERSRLELMLLLFLAHRELLDEGDGVYDFIPYKCGPFSFVARRDLELLKDRGNLIETRRRFSVDHDAAEQAIARLTSGQRQALGRLRDACAGLDRRALHDRAVEGFPWFASRRLFGGPDRSQPPRAAPATLYTMGYEGQSIDGFLDALMRCGIQCVLDVRRNPVSHKYGFAKSALRMLAGRVGLRYEHLPALGIPRAYRQTLRGADDYAQLFQVYETSLLPQAGAAVAQACRIAGEQPSVLICFERDPRFCHRSRLARAMAARSGLRVAHLQADGGTPQTI